MDRAKEGDFTILVTTPALLRTLKTNYKENARIELVWFDVSPPSDPLADIYVLASICCASTVLVLLDTSHKRTFDTEKLLKQVTSPSAILSAQEAVAFPEPATILSRANGHARLHPSAAEDLFHRWMSTMPHDQYWVPKVDFTYRISTLSSGAKHGKPRPVKQHTCTISSWPALCPFRGDVTSPPAPSKRLARQQACCEALRQLDQLAQFDSSLRPAHQRKLNEHSSDSDFSDFDKKKVRMYSTLVPEIWRSSTSVAEQPNCKIWIYSVEIEGVDATPNPDKSGVGFVTAGSPLPIEKVPTFTVFDHITSKPATGAALNVRVTLRNSISATTAQIQQLRQFHGSVFKHILPGLSAVQDWGWNESDPRNYIIAPIMKVDGGSWSVNWDAAQPWWESSSSSAGALPFDWKAYESHAAFEQVVKESILVLQTNQQVVVGSDVKWDLSPDSKWPFAVKFMSPLKLSSEEATASGPQSVPANELQSSSTETTPTKAKRIASNGEFYTFRDHFRDRWGLLLADGPQPIVGVRPFAFRAVNALIPPTQANTNQSEVAVTPTKVSNEMQFQMFPELCRRLPISAIEFRFFRFLPSIFMRIEGLVKASHLIFDVVTLPKPSDIDSRAALVSHVLEALTAPSCSEAINFEQLETVGDCFLKFVACLDTFLRNPLLHEFQLEIVKHLFVANKTLYEKSVKWNLGCYLNTRHSKVENWVPPGIHLTKCVFPPLFLVSFTSILVKLNFFLSPQPCCGAKY
jgi:dsRNA-specific ribonuclease